MQISAMRKTVAEERHDSQKHMYTLILPARDACEEDWYVCVLYGAYFQ